jgi:predicted DNA-binding protein YlxM (UPF0122 family)
MLNKVIEMGILFDFYGNLLTDKQRFIIELYYLEDLSLAEIAEQMNISRQGVYDTLKRAEIKLYNYEKKLGLIKKFQSNKEKIKTILNYSYEIEKEAKSIKNDEIVEKSERIQKVAIEIISQEGK